MGDGEEKSKLSMGRTGSGYIFMYFSTQVEMVMLFN